MQLAHNSSPVQNTRHSLAHGPLSGASRQHSHAATVAAKSRGEARMRLENKIAIVTGVGGRNGETIALGFAREGADLVAVDEDGARAEAVAEQARKLGRKALALQVDVTKKAEVTEMVQRTVSEFGRI